MSHLYEQVYKKRKYYDRALCNDYEDWLNKIQYSKTVYIGNLSIYTTEQQIYEVRKAHFMKICEEKTYFILFYFILFLLFFYSI